MTQKKEDATFKALRREAESILDTQPETTDTLHLDEVRKTSHELQVHRIELDLQNEKLRETRQVFEKAHSRYMDLFNQALIGYVVLDTTGIIKQVNTTFTRMMRIKASELIGIPFKNLLAAGDDAVFLARFKALTRYPGGERVDLRFGEGLNILFHGRLEAVSCAETSTDQQNSTGELLVTISDVTQELDAMTALARERDKAQSYFNVAAAIQIVLNQDGSVAQINEAGCRVLGAEKSSIVGRNWFDEYLPSEEKNAVKSVFKSILAGEIAPVEFNESTILTADGQRRLISWHNAVLKDASGAITEVLSSGEDITAKHQAEASLKAIEWLLERPTQPIGETSFSYAELTRLNRSRLIQDNIGLGVLRDMVGGYLDLLGTTAAVFEKNGDYAYRMVADGWCRLLDSASRKLCRTDNTATALSCGKWLCHESGFKIAEKSMLSQKPEEGQCHCGICSYAVPILTEEQCVGAVSFCYGDPPRHNEQLEKISLRYNTNPAELRAAAEAYEHRPLFITEIAKSRLRNSARLMAALVQSKCCQYSLDKERESLKVTLRSIGDGVITTDIQGRVILINKVAETLTGWSQQEARGKKLSEVFRIFEDKSRPPCENPFEKIVKNRRVVQLPKETILISRNGTQHRIADSGAPIVQQNGDIIGVVMVFRDITRQITLENELRHAQKMEAIGNLAGGIAHEFNNVLSIILGNTELAIDDLEPGHMVAENLLEIKTAGERAKEVVRQLLNFSRKMGVRMDRLDLGQVVDESLTLIKASLPANIEIKKRFPVELDILMADAAQLQQLLINLCNNAAHAMASAGGVLTITLSNATWETKAQTPPHGLAPGRYVKLSVHDTGHGIPKHFIDRIFDPYFTTKAVGEGTGMGLAVAHGIVKAHKGAICVTSEPGKGTRFDIYFPSQKRAREDIPQTRSAIPTGKERILLIDDEPSLAAVGDMILTRLGYKVTKVLNPLDALRLFQAKPHAFDLVISDMAMPEMMGDQLARKIFKIRPQTPFILCTGYNEKITDRKAAALGIKEVLHKPVTRKALANAIRRGLA